MITIVLSAFCCWDCNELVAALGSVYPDDDQVELYCKRDTEPVDYCVLSNGWFSLPE